MTALTRGAAAVLMMALSAAAASAQATVADTFSATASVKRGSTSASAPLRATVTRYATAAERDAVIKALRGGGTAALQKALSGMSDVGFIQLGDKRTPLRFASERPTGDGRLVTLVTAEPILFLGAGLPAAKPVAGFDVAVAILELKHGGVGLGDLSPAAKVGVDDQGALLIEDYGATVVWLNGVTGATSR
jgi:hypothetical protein